MKNLINYYYNLIINDFKKTNDKFIFEIDNISYEFTPFYGDVNNLYRIFLILKSNNKYCHEIVFNKNKNIITFYNDIPHLLLKKNICINNIVDIDEIINYDIPIYGEKGVDWRDLWKDKIDYYEYQMGQLSIKYKLLKNSFDYYVGLSETAISLLNYVDMKEIKKYVSHRRIEENEKLEDFFNPINIVFDSRTRDIAEYLKKCFFSELVDANKVLYYIENLHLSYTESLLFLSRLLYPSYYFDVYDQIIQDKISEDKINFYTKKNTSYEIFLKKIYNYIKKEYNIPEIEWLEI